MILGLLIVFSVGFIKYKHITRPSFEINGQKINDFVYWLNSPNLTALMETPFDVVVIDYSRDGTDEQAFTYQEIQQLKQSNGGKIVLSYLSIGEAENYRYYWNQSWDADNDGVPDKDAPDWLLEENPEWKGNYAVKYWNPDWQRIIFGRNDSYLDKIIVAGFDGVMLDKVDEFEYFEDNITNARELMIDFVLSLIEYAKSKNPSFLVFPQNGEALLENHTYLNAISGVVKEDLYFQGDKSQDQSARDYIIPLLKRVTNQSKPVFCMEYPTFYPYKVMAYIDAYSDGFLAYVGPRNADHIEITLLFEPE